MNNSPECNACNAYQVENVAKTCQDHADFTNFDTNQDCKDLLDRLSALTSSKEFWSEKDLNELSKLMLKHAFELGKIAGAKKVRQNVEKYQQYVQGLYE